MVKNSHVFIGWVGSTFLRGGEVKRESCFQPSTPRKQSTSVPELGGKTTYRELDLRESRQG